MAISLKHKSVTIDVNNRNAPNVVGIVNVNDKATRYLDVTLTASGEKLTFADCTVTATFATDGYLISDSVACTLNSTADLITVPLENFKSTSGFLSIEIKIANGETQVLNTPLTLKVMVTPSLAENSKINNESIGSFVGISREIATARGGSNSLGARLDTVDTNLAKKANKANTLAGYGIMDGIKDAAGTVRAVNLAADVINKFGEKVDSSELFDVTKSINLANLADYSQHQNGVTVTVAKGKISLSGTSTAATNFFLPLKSSITLRIDTPYCLSLQDFTTNNTGCVFYPAYNQNVINSKWLLSEVSALKNAAATYTPIQYMFVNSIKIAVAANRLTDNSCYLQIEQNNQKTAYVNPEKIVQKVKPTLYQAPDYTMHYLYVSNDYNEGTEGFGETKFNSILSANNSISDNSYHNRYTIIVAQGTYTDMQDRYAGMSDVGLVGYRGVMTKDYVYYESENIYNPAATIIKWDGATGFDKSTLKSEDIIKKCPFHLDLNVHTHIKGFTFDCKNIRYGLHLESGGTGYATEWTVSNCIFKWGGRADCVDYANKTTVPVFGCGHSFGEVGLIENCKIIPTHCTIGYQNHDNADNSDFGLPIKVGAKITFKDCDFGGTEIQARTLKGAYADTPNVLTIDNCINISAINKMYAAPADHCDWIVNTINSKNEQN
ncbi:MAG TPA: hypothetical protein OIM16_09320 [Oscillospiraceae bacterium]|nr:hypothetical protein [Oscillospiraceae bacterium]